MKWSHWALTAFVSPPTTRTTTTTTTNNNNQCIDYVCKNKNKNEMMKTMMLPTPLLQVDFGSIDEARWMLQQQQQQQQAHTSSLLAMRHNVGSDGSLIIMSRFSSVEHQLSSLSSSSSPSVLQQGIQSWLQHLVVVEPAAAATTATSGASSSSSPPTKEEVQLLNEALGAYYGKTPNPVKAEELLSKAIVAWQRQADDEKAALYRIRGDCYMSLLRPADAVKDFSVAIELLEGPDGDLADPTELPAARLGRARSIRSMGSSNSKQQHVMAANDYRTALMLTSRDDDWDTDEERVQDGAARNPYAAWEWGSTLRSSGDYEAASKAHAMAAVAFDAIGDKPRSIISELDVGIDLASGLSSSSSSSNKNANTNKDAIKAATSALEKAIDKTTRAEGRDVALLQRVIAKEGEARVALASILWDTNDKPGAEKQLGEACIRLEQLEADAQERAAKGSNVDGPAPVTKMKFSIDDIAGAGEISCSRFRSQDFLVKKLQWPESLQSKVTKLENLVT